MKVTANKDNYSKTLKAEAEALGLSTGLIGQEYWVKDDIELHKNLDRPGNRDLILVGWAKPHGNDYEFLIRVTHAGNLDHPDYPLFSCRGKNVEATIRRRCEKYGDLKHLPSFLNDLRQSVDEKR